MTGVTVVAPGERLPAGRVWGHGGWSMPAEREALDWATLARLAGLTASLTTPAEIGALPETTSRVVVACDPDLLTSAEVDWLAAACERGTHVISRAAAPGHPLAGLTGAARAPGLPDVSIRQVGAGRLVTLGVHPSEARDEDGAWTARLRELLVDGRETTPLVDPGTLVLRMDDPGGAQNVHLRSWRHRELDAGAWARIGDVLRARGARMSVGYVGGWVDDGDASRGELFVDGEPAERTPGAVHPSPGVRYLQDDGTDHDYAGEFRAIRALVDQGLVSVELHGFTHMHPDRSASAGAADRYEAERWYRELGSDAMPALERLGVDGHPLSTGVDVLARSFGARPTALIPPGDRWTDDAVAVALDLGIDLVSSYYLGFRDGDALWWSQHVCAPYLDEPDPAWFRSGLPVIGYFHDRDVALHGPTWLADALDRWAEAGAARFIDLATLASKLRSR